MTFRPIVKWAGGKTRLLPDLISRVPKQFDRYVEPFFGGGALFFELANMGLIEKARISDSNVDLIGLYRCIVDDLDPLLTYIEAYSRGMDKLKYLRMRGSYNRREPCYSVIRHAQTYCLNRWSFNGIWRVNRDGHFNVPYCHAQRNPDYAGIIRSRSALGYADIVPCGYDETEIIAGDFFYLDPPYLGTFSEYGSYKFEGEDHLKLADWLIKLDSAGAKFMLSNCAQAAPLYDDRFRIETVSVQCSVGGKKAHRGMREEILVMNYPAEEQRDEQ